MKSIHLVTTARDGGGTGKSTFSSMLTGYLCRPESERGTVALLDLSYTARLYSKMFNLFGQPSEEFIGEQDCFYSEEERKTLIVVKGDAVHTGDLLVEIIDAVYEDYHFDHLICETNLATNTENTRAFFRRLVGTRYSGVSLYMWTTWKAEAVTDPDQYTAYQILFSGTPSGVFWNFVHNPYTSSTGRPENTISPSMKLCHELPLGDPCSPQDLWAFCGSPARNAARSDGTYEELWQEAYKGFIEQGFRPYNLLPVFQRSRGWEIAALRNFLLPDICVEAPSSLWNALNHISDGLYTNVFGTYFDEFGIR